MKVIHILLSFIICTYQRCSFSVNSSNIPQKVNTQPVLLQGLTICQQYNGRMGCCNQFSDIQQSKSYQQIDGVFGSTGGGCELCAINLKRMWCEYACSNRQSQFIEVEDGYYPFDDPQKPGQKIMAQKVTLRVFGDTACDLYNSCKRVGFVTSVSAMSSPAGFLTFQGHNAIDDGKQYIEVNFSQQKNNSLYFSDQQAQFYRKRLTPCNYTTNETTFHKFQFIKNCSCNTCQSSCQDKNGFIYKESDILDGFNGIFVGTVWITTIITTILLKIYRSKSINKKQ